MGWTLDGDVVRSIYKEWVQETLHEEYVIDYFGPVALILACGLFADNLLIKGKLKELRLRLEDIEKALRDRH